LNLPLFERDAHVLKFLLNSDNEEEHEGDGVDGAGGAEEKK